MKELFCLLFLAAGMIFTGGCALFEDEGNGEEPTTDPYVIPVRKDPVPRQADPVSKEENLVNEIVSAISVKMALSARGPYRVQYEKSPSAVGRKVIHQLHSMGLIRAFAKDVLYYSEVTEKGRNKLCFGTVPRGKDFCTYFISTGESKP